MFMHVAVGHLLRRKAREGLLGVGALQVLFAIAGLLEPVTGKFVHVSSSSSSSSSSSPTSASSSPSGAVSSSSSSSVSSSTRGGEWSPPVLPGMGETITDMDAVEHFLLDFEIWVYTSPETQVRLLCCVVLRCAVSCCAMLCIHMDLATTVHPPPFLSFLLTVSPSTYFPPTLLPS